MNRVVDEYIRPRAYDIHSDAQLGALLGKAEVLFTKEVELAMLMAHAGLIGAGLSHLRSNLKQDFDTAAIVGKNIDVVDTDIRHMNADTWQ